MNFRHEYLSALVKQLCDEIIVTNTGGTQHELFALGDRDANLYVAGIGLVSQVALGLVIALPNRKIIAFDGDGSLLLNLGILPVLAQQTPANLLVVVFDNGLYESGGNTATLAASGMDLAAIARGAGIVHPKAIDSLDEFLKHLKPGLGRSAFDFWVVQGDPEDFSSLPKKCPEWKTSSFYAPYRSHGREADVFHSDSNFTKTRRPRSSKNPMAVEGN